MQLIVAVDQNWGIGYQGKLLFSIAEDMKHFRSVTTDKVVVMGRATLESLPSGKALPKRVNIVLSTNEAFAPADVTVVHSEDALLRAVSVYREQDVFVIGGEAIYRRLLPYCTTAHITRVREAAQHVDRYFPQIDTLEGWTLAEEAAAKGSESPVYSFCTYHNSAPKPNPYATQER